MEFYTYKGISAGKYVEGEIEALNQDEASHKLKEQKLIITNLVRSKKKKDKKTKKKSEGTSFFKNKNKPKYN
jgi:type IV pilus assembly protein PilC